MLVTDDAHLHARCLVLRDQGRAKDAKHRFWIEEIGYRYRMSSVQAALGIAQTERLDELVAKKRQIFAWYESRLSDIEQLKLNPAIPGVWNSYWMVTAILDAKVGMMGEDLMRLLATEGVELDFRSDAIDEIALLAEQINATVENIGARRLHTILERLLEEISFTASDQTNGTAVSIDAATVRDRVGALAQNADLSRFIL